MFNEAFISEIKARTSLAKLISQKLKLQKKGDSYLGLCPFHQEKTPSFTVQDRKGFYYCFGCQATGDAFEFIAKTEKLSFSESVEKLANLAGLELPKNNPAVDKIFATKKVILQINELASKYFQDQLKYTTNKAVNEYLNKRALSLDDILKFSIGYSPLENNLADKLLKQNFTRDDLVKSGLFYLNKDKLTCRFINRLIFPIKNLQKNIIAFGARALNTNDHPKYLNSPETDSFKKNETVYSLDLAREAAIKHNEIIVVEGYLDTIALHKINIVNCVATLGTAIGIEHLNLLWKIVDHIKLCFDGDAAGYKAMLNIAHKSLSLLKPGLKISFTIIPNQQDPDDYIKKNGLDKMVQLLNQDLTLAEFLWQNELKNLEKHSPDDKAALEYRVLDNLKEINNKIIFNHYKKFFQDKIWQEFNRKPYMITLKQRSTQKLNFQNNHLNPIERLEITLFALLLQNINLLKDDMIYNYFLNLELKSTELEEFHKIILEFYKDPAQDLNELIKKYNLVTLGSKLFEQNSSFIGILTDNSMVSINEIWLLTYQKYYLELLKLEFKECLAKFSIDEKFWHQSVEIKKNIEKIQQEILYKESQLYSKE